MANTLQGNLVFDHGLPAASVTVHLYDIGFGGQESRLGEVKSDSQGNYSFSYSPPSAGALNLQVRALNPAAKEITISATKYNASQSDTLNLVVPASVQPLAPEFQRLSTDVAKSIGDISKLGQAQEGPDRQDLTLLSQSTNWDARLIALTATAVQQTATTGLGQDVLYALFRVGLPSDPLLLAAVPPATIQQALAKAAKAGIVSLTEQQIASATSTFQKFAGKTLLASKAPGAVTSFNDLLTPQLKDPAQLNAFANLYFSQTKSGSDLWTEAANLGIPAPTLDALKLQGKFLYLTSNNGPLTQKLQQDFGSPDKLPELADKDYHLPATWQNALTALAGSGGDKALAGLIPPIYTGASTMERLAAYAGDLARKVRMSFPTRVVARMVENQGLAVDPKVAGNVTNFLRIASTLGYSLGRTPLNAFLTNSAKNLPALDDASKQSVKTLHRLFQITPSNESLQAVLKLGFTSAFDIASHSKANFMVKYAYAFPPGEAELVYGQAQSVKSVTFNAFVMAKGLDNIPLLYAMSSSNDERQDAKEALVKQFPSMTNLFGNLDFCQCDDSQSVLSPAAYFVDLLDLMGQHSAANAAGNTPLDVLIGKQKVINGRRPDLGALPLTSANTNTAMPYIDLVNEILEYSIAHNNNLGAEAAYDTGPETTADLTAEPQHVLPDVYSNTLKQAFYPLTLPFDLWIETVRGFLNYFKIPLPKVLDTFRPADTLELFTSSPLSPYYRAQILAESLGISPAEYAVFTATDPNNWFQLYGYAVEATAQGELKSAKTLSQKLGVSYQKLRDLLKTGFLNPNLYALIFQFERFGIDMETAFSYTNQHGYPALTAQQTVDFQALLDAITAHYKKQNPTFDAKAWLNKVLPAKYSSTVLVLADPNTDCDFSGTTLQYADGQTAAQPLDFLKLNLFVRLAKKLGCTLDDSDNGPNEPNADGSGAATWTLDEVDRALQVFFPQNQPFGEAWKTALVYLAHLDDLNTRLAPALGRAALLPLWGNLPTQGENPLYAQLFLTPCVVNDEPAFDDPNGGFPSQAADLPKDQRTLNAHVAAIQGALGLTAADVDGILTDALPISLVPGPGLPGAKPGTPAVGPGISIQLSRPDFTLGNLSICYRYSLLAKCLKLSVSDMIALKTMSGLFPFQPLTGVSLKVLADDVLLNQTLAFVKQVAAVNNSGFTVEDLKYLLRHQFDPLGKYLSDPNALIALVQSVAAGLRQIQAQNTVPSDVMSMSESLIDQSLSGLFPAAILKTLFTQITNAQTYTASGPRQDPTPLKPADLASAPEVTLSYDDVTQTQSLSYKGLLMDWRKAELKLLNTDPKLAKVLAYLLDGVQQQARTALNNSIDDILGVWASLVQYEAVPTSTVKISNAGTLAQADASLCFKCEPSGLLRLLGYRGVLTAAKLTELATIDHTATDSSTPIGKLLSDVQNQALPAHDELIGSLLGMWCNAQTYKATQSGVRSEDQIDQAAVSAALATAQQRGTITGPVPAIQFTYDSASQIQTLTCNGVLTSDLQGKIAGLVPKSKVFATLLQTVYDQAVQLFQFLATNLLTLGPKDPDKYLKTFGLGLSL